MNFLLQAMSDNGQPSASRVVTVVGLLVFAPLLLLGCLIWAETEFGLAFEVWVSICGGVYVGGRFASRPTSGSGGTPNPPNPSV